MIHLAIFGSTRGTNLNAIVEAINNNKLNAKIELVFSNKAQAPILVRAENFGLKTACVDPKDLSPEFFDKQLSNLLLAHRIDLVVLLGYMRILSPKFVLDWKNKIINVHPSILPAYAGLMDLEVHQAVLDASETITGCTVHFVTEEVDAGPIILQKNCRVFKNDTAEQLKKRVQQLEAKALVAAIKQIESKKSGILDKGFH